MTGFEVWVIGLLGILTTLQKERHKNDVDFDIAILAIKKALLETKKHVESNYSKRDRSKEYQLAQLWSEASIKAKRANIPFEALNQKSLYWEDEEIWKQDQAAVKGIEFSQIEERLNGLLPNS